MEFGDIGRSIELVGELVDVAGVGLIVIGLVFATGRFLFTVRQDSLAAYRGYREGLGRALLLGLEFLVAADIIRTVAITPDFRNLGVLAIIVLVRTFLSWSLEVELEGRWPWQRPGHAPSSIENASQTQAAGPSDSHE